MRSFLGALLVVAQALMVVVLEAATLGFSQSHHDLMDLQPVRPDSGSALVTETSLNYSRWASYLAEGDHMSLHLRRHCTLVAIMVTTIPIFADIS